MCEARSHSRWNLATDLTSDSTRTTVLESWVNSRFYSWAESWINVKKIHSARSSPREVQCLHCSTPWNMEKIDINMTSAYRILIITFFFNFLRWIISNQSASIKVPKLFTATRVMDFFLRSHCCCQIARGWWGVHEIMNNNIVRKNTEDLPEKGWTYWRRDEHKRRKYYTASFHDKSFTDRARREKNGCRQNLGGVFALAGVGAWINDWTKKWLQHFPTRRGFQHPVEWKVRNLPTNSFEINPRFNWSLQFMNYRRSLWTCAPCFQKQFWNESVFFILHPSFYVWCAKQARWNHQRDIIAMVWKWKYFGVVNSEHRVANNIFCTSTSQTDLLSTAWNDVSHNSICDSIHDEKGKLYSVWS